jgi:TolA-binding protein
MGNEVVMRSILSAVLVLSTGAVWCTVAGPARAQDKPPADAKERALFDKACDAFNKSEMGPASTALNDFLRDFPKSALAPEAAFKLSAAQGLQGKCAESLQARDRLVHDYITSPWALLILCTQYDEKQLLALANERRLKGIKENSNPDYGSALGIYNLCLKRCGEKAKQSPMAQNEVTETGKEALYRMGDCLHRLGQEEPFKSVMQQIQAADAQGSWGKLATVRLGDDHVFQDHMDDLLNMHVAGDEELHVFLELADKHVAKLDGDALIKCLYYKARCRAGLQESDKAVTLCQEVIARHPKSKWAAESMMYMAEQEFDKGDTARAKALYLDLAKKYPDSPRAAQARAWAGWLDNADKDWKELQELLVSLALKGSAGKGAFSLRVSRQAEGGGKSIEGRVAFQDAQHYLLSLAVGPAAFLVAKNDEGQWCRFLDRPEVIKCKKGADMPLPQLIVKDDAQFSFNWGFGAQAPAQSGPPIQIAPKAAEVYVGQWKKLFHLKKEKAAEGRVVYRLQQPTWEHQKPVEYEIMIDATKAIQKIRLTLYNDKAEKSVWTITDLCIGGPLPDKVLKPELSSDLTVRTVEELNPMEVFSGVMRLFTVFMEAAGTDGKKK